MKTSDQTDQIIAALLAAAAKIPGVHKSKRNIAQNYQYAAMEDFLRASKDELLAVGVIAASSVEQIRDCGAFMTKGGSSMNRVLVRVATRFMHQSGQWIQIYSWGEGTDVQDKATYKAITGARKYAIASALNLATTDDPEAPSAFDTEYGREPVGYPVEGSAAPNSTTTKTPITGRY